MKYKFSYQNNPILVFRRKKLRRDSTWAEKLFWINVRDKRIGYKFRRQFSIDRYIADFYCHKLKLIVEIDGYTHENDQQQIYDKQRQNYLMCKGYGVIRYTDEQVLCDTESVIIDLKNKCQSRYTLITPPDLP